MSSQLSRSFGGSTQTLPVLCPAPSAPLIEPARTGRTTADRAEGAEADARERRASRRRRNPSSSPFTEKARRNRRSHYDSRPNEIRCGLECRTGNSPGLAGRVPRSASLECQKSSVRRGAARAETLTRIDSLRSPTIHSSVSVPPSAVPDRGGASIRSSRNFIEVFERFRCCTGQLYDAVGGTRKRAFIRLRKKARNGRSYCAIPLPLP